MNTPTVLFSGGLDSLVALAVAREDSNRNPHIVFCEVGFTSSRKEEIATKKIAKYYQCKATYLDMYLPHFGKHPMCAKDRYLTYAAPAENADTSNVVGSHRPFVIPYRNYFLISLALSVCATKNSDTLYLGFDYEGKGGSSIDKSPEFVNAFQQAIYAGTEPDVSPIQLITPFQGKAKKDIIRLGLELRVPFELSWTCCNDFGKSCGICSSCVDRLIGFAEVGACDPLEYVKESTLKRKLGSARYNRIRERCGISYELGKSSKAL